MNSVQLRRMYDTTSDMFNAACVGARFLCGRESEWLDLLTKFNKFDHFQCWSVFNASSVAVAQVDAAALNSPRKLQSEFRQNDQNVSQSGSSLAQGAGAYSAQHLSASMLLYLVPGRCDDFSCKKLPGYDVDTVGSHESLSAHAFRLKEKMEAGKQKALDQCLTLRMRKCTATNNHRLWSF